MGQIAKLRQPTLTPERQALADAVERAAAAEADSDNARLAVGRARSMVAAAAGKVEQAAEALARAKRAGAAITAEAATRGAQTGPNIALREARAEAIEAQDELEAAQAALELVEAAVPDAERTARRAKEGVTTAARAMLARHGLKLLAEAQATQEHLVRLRLALRFALGVSPSTSPDAEAARRFLHEQLPPAPGAVEYQDWDAHPEAQRWRQALADLIGDPSAQLPDMS